jgi:hypothetical protein
MEGYGRGQAVSAARRSAGEERREAGARQAGDQQFDVGRHGQGGIEGQVEAAGPP